MTKTVDIIKIHKKIRDGKRLTKKEEIALEEYENTHTESRESMSDKFTQGIVAALDVVAVYGEWTIFEAIIRTAGIQEVLKEIRENGLERTKEMAETIFETSGDLCPRAEDINEVGK